MLGWVLAGVSIIGSILNVKLYRLGFVLWMISNSGWIFYGIITEEYSQIPMWLVFNVTCLYGLISWTKKSPGGKKDDAEVQGCKGSA